MGLINFILGELEARKEDEYKAALERQCNKALGESVVQNKDGQLKIYRPCFTGDDDISDSERGKCSTDYEWG